MILFASMMFAVAALVVVFGPLLLPWGWALPLGALLTLPLIYFGWRATLIFTLGLGLLWEAPLPLSMGSVAISLTVAVLLLQLFLRHQLRSSPWGLALAGVLLHSVVLMVLGLQFPPQTIAGGVLQFFSSALQLLVAGALSLGWLWAAQLLAHRLFQLHLERRLKDL